MTPYYDESGVTIYHGNCLDVLSTLTAVDHVITDPPYEAEAHTQARRSSPDKGAAVVDLAIAFEPIAEDTRMAAGREFARLARRWILVFCQVEAAMLWRHATPARYVRTQVWRKPDGAPQFTGDRPGMGYESILTCHGGTGRMRWNGGGRHGYYEYCVNNFGRLTNGMPHPTMKPEPLMCELVTLFTDSGETILDPFMGSGTTLVAAKRFGRKAIGIELNEKYCEIAAKRLAQGALPLEFSA
jgi:16S rRNA G966 N2-methylase RsmD